MAGYIIGSAEHLKFLFEKFIENSEKGDIEKSQYFLNELLKHDPNVVNIMQTALLDIADYIASLK